MESKNIDDLHFKIYRNGVIEKWSRYFVDRLRKQLRKLKIGKTGALERGIARQLVLTNGDVTAVFLRFAMYGRFVDMGVGRGLKAYERQSNRTFATGAKRYGADVSYNGRRPKRWFNKPKTAQIHRLRELLEAEMQSSAVRNMRSELMEVTEYSINL